MRFPLRRLCQALAFLLALTVVASANVTTTNKGFNQPTVGGDSNLWGTFLDQNFGILDSNLGGVAPVPITGATQTATTAQAQALVQKLTGVLTAPSTYSLPAAGSFYIIDNETTGNFSLTVNTVAGGSTGVIVPQGVKTLVYSDGTNINYHTALNTALATPLPQAQGGTGQSATNSVPIAGDVTGTLGASTVAKVNGNSVHVPTRTVLTSGSGTYTPPAGVIRINVRMAGGGGGGGGNGTSGQTGGGSGTDTTFGTFTAGHGTGGTAGSAGGIGSGGSGGTASGAPNIGIAGAAGAPGLAPAGTPQGTIPGADGGSSCWGGAGRGTTGNGGAAATNSGSGGAGAAGNSTVFAAGSGGAGACVEELITSLAASYAYTVGTGGAAGSAGTSGSTGGLAAVGLIVIEEAYY